MKYIRLCILLLTCTAVLLSCQTPLMSHIPKDISPYTITPLSLPYPKLCKTPWYPEDKIHVSKNGSIIISLSQMLTSAQTYYLHTLYTPDSTRLTGDNRDTFHIAWETDEGNWILSTGEAAVYDENWNLLASLDRPMYAGYPLDGGRYYAVNDTYRQEIGFAVGVDGENNPELYALYRYTERLTDCVYTRIEPTEGGFHCYTDKTNYVLYPADDMIAMPEPTFFVAQDERSGMYYYVDGTGERILDKRFTYAFPPDGNYAVAWVYDKAYLISYEP